MPRHIGIVACSAPGAALCYETICAEGARSSSKGQPEISIHAHPLDRYLRHIAASDWKGVAELMLSSGEKLACAGAEFLVSPCNTIHEAFDLVAARSRLPWLHIAEEVSREAKRLGFRNVALLGSRLVMEGSVYPSKMRKAGIDFCIPEDTDRNAIDRFIFDEMVHGQFTREARNCVLDVVGRLREAGCDAVGMCCTELPLLLASGESPLPPLDSTRILARAALRHSLEESGG